ncbi:response regulator transcription factor [Paenibacillus apiarius]|uniref:Response regulator n=1 Tax=Paenibacillus apiarius TaxID=46240 RepID=A0ABT4DZA8_9BACL|nr:response regulator [Paenibacillus apiarius]MCY9513031.1 response regulator [Paenibacillus apiarius]MCY9521613.1 response regulator [Paenibacillus apiarius]MCY9551765.1 response regulator [Paenibacillus apiarius]MCY9560446.1 response regulator [Paenibacillus apiarius]MCY9685304.1 response regulator [Paenibacillus apiarius]
MYRLLIVDDLPIIVDGLLELFEQTEHLELDIMKAYSGEEALEVLRNSSVDIVISDIKMPGLEGIELLQAIKAQWPACKVIFLTGYNDFHYIQSVITYGGFDYILKVESDEKIIRSVERAIAKLEEEGDQRLMVERANNRMRQALPLLQKEYAWELLQGKQETAGELARHLQDFDIPLRADLPVLLLLGRVDAWKDTFTTPDKALLIYGVQNITEEYVTPYVRSYSCVYDTSKIVWLIQPQELAAASLAAEPFASCGMRTSGGPASASAAWRKLYSCLSGTLDTIQRTCKQLLQVTVSFALSSAPTEWHSVSDRFHMLKYCFVYGLGLSNEVIVTDSDILQLQESATEGAANDFFHQTRIQLLLKCLENNHREEFCKLYLHLTKIWSEDSRAYERKMELYHSLAAIFLSFLSQNEAFKQKVIKSLDLTLLYHRDDSVSWQDLKQYFLEMADCLFEGQAAQGERMPVEWVQKVHRYIEENVSTDISLCAIADYVGLNPSYFSRLYKQMTGIGLSDYINDYRNLQAKKWLLNSSMKVNEIAAALGYNSALAFIRFFKKQNQTTPQEYRMQRQSTG